MRRVILHGLGRKNPTTTMPEPVDILENRLFCDKPDVLTTLLADHTTQKNIFWATQSYASLGEGYGFADPITVAAITGDNGNVIRPRAVKAREEQQQRSREMAEVFTPSWLCNEMNNAIDTEWFGRDDVFNTVGDDHQWHPQPAAIDMPEGKTWQDYALTTRLEITCGEAPFLVSRYDTVTGLAIPLSQRIGILDRKLRVVSENAAGEAEWSRWALIALGSCYGYEWQGDSLLLAREAVVETFAEYYEQRFGRPIGETLLAQAAEIVSWNFWQMDGLKGVVPCSCKKTTIVEPILFGETKVSEDICSGCASGDITKHNGLYCQLRRWIPSDGTMPDSLDFSFLDILNKKYKTYHKTKWLMKFDFIIGNPPYQDETVGEQKTFMPPVYDKFMDATYQLADKVELITPARFLFNAGSTPKAWNKKMLSDKHFKVLKYISDSSKLFSNTEIKGGVAISYHALNENFGPIDNFIANKPLNDIDHKVIRHQDFVDFTKIVVSAYSYKFTDKLHQEHTDVKGLLSKGHMYDFKSNVFERLDHTANPIFYSQAPIDGKKYIKVLGIYKKKRAIRFIESDYINQDVENFNHYKVFLAAATSNGKLGETLSEPIIGLPNEASTESFISIGCFDYEDEAYNLEKYIKTKFLRLLMGIMKVTPHVTTAIWHHVPLQDFTSSSDIDWSKSIHEIDLQLYDKYGLTDAERNFIETHVKPME